MESYAASHDEGRGSPTVAIAVIQVGISPQAGGRCHGEPKMSIPLRIRRRQPPQRIRIRQFLSRRSPACAPCAERYPSGGAAAGDTGSAWCYFLLARHPGSRGREHDSAGFRRAAVGAQCVPVRAVDACAGAAVGAGAFFSHPPGVDDVGDGERAGSGLGADDLGAEYACEQDHGGVPFCRVPFRRRCRIIVTRLSTDCFRCR